MYGEPSLENFIGMLIGFVKRKWKNMLDTHRREVYKQKVEKRNGPIKWKFSKEMEFVSDQYIFTSKKEKPSPRSIHNPLEIVDAFNVFNYKKHDPLESDEQSGSPSHFPNEQSGSHFHHSDEQPSSPFHLSNEQSAPSLHLRNEQSASPHHVMPKVEHDVFVDINSDSYEESDLTNYNRRYITDKIVTKLREVKSLTEDLELSYFNETGDEDMQFLKSLHSSLSSIPYPAKLLVRTKIQEIVYDFTKSHEQENICF
ncbi:uncharacterized protein [Lepeophtheirus salmonis]|uniref:uncharacterized protein isoform X1 n=2 Tax=Lepeophtheirus salmonis TaxID=72036 RepID=UPI001AEA14F3|nr:uncharacterized protein LOC121124504 isoform X2 [Lepeophtheirus salmonis]